jgi:hypothetical protein
VEVLADRDVPHVAAEALVMARDFEDVVKRVADRSTQGGILLTKRVRSII